MKVLHIINNYSKYTGGAERLVQKLHINLLENNVESHLLGLSQQKDNLLKNAISLHLKSPYSLRAIFNIYKYLKSYKQTENTIVHSHLFPAIFYCALLKKTGLIKGHLVTTEHSTFNGRRGKIWGKILDRFIFKQHDHIYAVSGGTKTELLRWLPGLKKKTTVINNGIPLIFNKPLLREEKSTKIIVSVGTLQKAKNYDTALHAIALIKHLDFKWFIAGDGEEFESLDHLIKKLKIEKKVKLIGRVNDVKSLLKKADIFLMPSRWESFGLAAVEAMNAGLPLVVSHVSGLREIVNNERECALLVNPIKPESIADALKQLILSFETRSLFGKNAFYNANTFSLQKMVDTYIKEYNKLTLVT